MRFRDFLIVAVIGAWLVNPAAAQRLRDSDYDRLRQQLVTDVIVPAGVTDQRVIDSVLQTRRHEFVPASQRKLAYYDMSLPIGSEQTISSPFIVAFMTESLDPQPDDRVLEIGTGSGYQAAILSPLVQDVYSIEIVESLGLRAQRTLKRLGYNNVHVKIGDGYQGWEEHAPFDKIVVTCSPEKVPQPLIDQLKDGGLIVVPVGERYQQTLYLLSKVNGELERTRLRPTLFVPMTGAAEEQREVLPNLELVTLKNGSFEEPLDESQHLPGWFYQRQVAQVADSSARDGEHFVRFSNQTPGRGSRLLQGLAVDGSRFKRLNVTAWVSTSNAVVGPEENMLPSIAISFYDKQRAPLGQQWMGPWPGTEPWQQVQKSFRVPSKAREAIFRVGLFGATGEFSVDAIQLEAVGR